MNLNIEKLEPAVFAVCSLLRVYLFSAESVCMPCVLFIKVGSKNRDAYHELKV